MKLPALFLCAMLPLLAACAGDGAAADGSPDNLKARAKVAEVNLARIRDAVVKYHKEKSEVPMSVSHLEGFGGGESELEPSEDYADIGYSFYSITFDSDGKLTQGWFIATPVAESGALKVRMNGVSGEFDYVEQAEDFGPAPSTLKNANQPD